MDAQMRRTPSGAFRSVTTVLLAVPAARTGSVERTAQITIAAAPINGFRPYRPDGAKETAARPLPMLFMTVSSQSSVPERFTILSDRGADTRVRVARVSDFRRRTAGARDHAGDGGKRGPDCRAH
ncbi:hypothetical protein PPNSA23_39340 [Phyllobacterium phragmitis]|uniref:Uncharacterized protein n=1 Tax=Phyllobacterium phragmitis TaxID=2670329 RepID=A0ABQ0H532_9HYPH